ncbi:MAG: tetratricopeptide repeat protein [Phycisphaerae bacterium]|nr:tetratricopeptide repeat protein [Phycisphaerae bacterium]
MSNAWSKIERARALLEQGKPDQAEPLLRRLIQQLPRSADAHSALSIVLAALRKHDQAAYFARAALALVPDNPGLTLNLAAMLWAAGKQDESIEHFARAAELDPARLETRLALLDALRESRRFARAEAGALEALQRWPDHPELVPRLAAAQIADSRPEAAADTARRALVRDPANHNLLSVLAHVLNYLPDTDPHRRESLDAHRRYGAALRAALGPGPTLPRRAVPPGQPLRVGLLSPDFRAHPVAIFSLPLLTHARAEGLDITCYMNLERSDPVTERTRALASRFRQVESLSTEALRDRIRADGIDILIDLSGHTQGHRLAVFQTRAAPVQATYLGYPNTTGVETMDFRIVDPHTDPPGADRDCTERLVRLDPCFICYAPLDPDAAPPPAPAAIPAHEPVRLGSFNTLLKITDDVIAAWAAILARVPDATLVIKNHALTEDDCRARVRDRFVAAGVDPVRLELAPPARLYADHLRAYHRVHLALDTFPYNGTTTTCEALWMGVPVVGLVGRIHAARVGVSLLHAAGLSQLLAPDRDAYIALAAALATDRPRLSALREGLRERTLASPLCDARAFTRRFARACRDMHAG